MEKEKEFTFQICFRGYKPNQVDYVISQLKQEYEMKLAGSRTQLAEAEAYIKKQQEQEKKLREKIEQLNSYLKRAKNSSYAREQHITQLEGQLEVSKQYKEDAEAYQAACASIGNIEFEGRRRVAEMESKIESEKENLLRSTHDACAQMQADAQEQSKKLRDATKAASTHIAEEIETAVEKIENAKESLLALVTLIENLEKECQPKEGNDKSVV
jgi:chromosome segregation ATPase